MKINPIGQEGGKSKLCKGFLCKFFQSFSSSQDCHNPKMGVGGGKPLNKRCEGPSLVVKNLPGSAGHTGLIPDRGRFYMPRGNQDRAPPLLKPMHPRARALPREAMAMRSLCTGARE